MNAKSRLYGALQSALFIAFAALYFLDPAKRVIGGDPVLTVVGDLLCLVGVGLLFVALRTIGKAIRIDPEPRADAALVTHGVYRVLRHPIYTAIVLILVGLVLRGATAAATGMAGAAILFLFVKARYEETLLSARYPEYEAYRRSTRGILL